MALFVVLGICVFASYVVRSASRRTEDTALGRDAVDPVAELPPLSVPSVIPDTVPSAWIDAYGTGDGT